MELVRADSLSVDVRADGIGFLRLDVSGRSHNVFNRQVLAELDAAFDRVAAHQPPLKLLVLYSGKSRGFVAGADLQQFATVRSPQEASALSETGQRLFDKLARLPMPTVAVIHGPCLGGGLEMALACDYRVVIDQPGTQLGLPEIELGLLPGWGGTQRLPRVIGVEHALRMILTRRRANAADAVRWGLADARAASQESFFSSLSASGEWVARGKRRMTGLPARNWRQRLLESNPLGRWLLLRGAERIARRRVPDDMPAPLEALNAVRVGLAKGMAAGLKYEREAIGRLATTPACRNLIGLFFLMERARKQTEAEPAPGASVRRVGVVGAGTMGAGIAQLAAVKGFEVVVQEVSEAALSAGTKRIETLFAKAAERGVLSADEARQKLEGIGRTTSWQGFDDVDLAIEAIIEDLDKKREVFRELDRRTRPTAVLATNTSALSVAPLLEGLAHPERVGGLHFFNPVHKMPLVEVVRAPSTAETAVGTLTQWAAAVGKTPVVVGDSPGFLVNRILMPYLSEAGRLVAEGIPVAVVDRVMRRFGMPMGPLELLDQVGLDVAAHIARAMKAVFGDRLGPDEALDRMSQQGWLGQKTGTGFYRYQGKQKRVNRELASLLPPGTVRHRRTGRTEQVQKHSLRDRMVLLMVNEAAACLGQGLAATAETVDLAMVLGTGWAPHRGGPLRYADDRGAADVVKTLDGLKVRYGPRFDPYAELRRRAATGEVFYSPFSVPQAV